MASNQSSDANLPVVDDMEGVYSFKQLLQHVDYPGGDVKKVLGPSLGSSYLRRDLPLFLRRLAAPTPVHVLVKLFALEVPVAEADARSALEPLGLERAIALGLVELDADQVRARMGLSAYDGLFLGHDLEGPENGGPKSNHVLAVNPASCTLANLTARCAARWTLDIGCGNGVQTLLAARHSKRVIAVDTNPRALRFTSFNALLNGFDNVECRQGSLFNPVEGLLFDLIVCNPPFVISPESRFQYRDSGMRGDTISEEIVRKMPAFLTEWGFACVLCNWVHGKQEHWSTPLRTWIRDSGCDCWLLHGDTQDPLTYAATWTRTSDPRSYGDTLDRWLHYYRELGIEEISAGGIILRRRPGISHWMRYDELPKDTGCGSGEFVTGIFAAQDYISALEDDMDLLDEAFHMPETLHADQTLAISHGQFVAEKIRLQLQQGLLFQVAIDAQILQILSRCNGTRTLTEILAEMNMPVELQTGEFARAAAKTVRRLIELGFLIPSKRPWASQVSLQRLRAHIPAV